MAPINEIRDVYAEDNVQEIANNLVNGVMQQVFNMEVQEEGEIPPSPTPSVLETPQLINVSPGLYDDASPFLPVGFAPERTSTTVPRRRASLDGIRARLFADGDEEEQERSDSVILVEEKYSGDDDDDDEAPMQEARETPSANGFVHLTVNILILMRVALTRRIHTLTQESCEGCQNDCLAQKYHYECLWLDWGKRLKDFLWTLFCQPTRRIFLKYQKKF
nr:uncharacterized protein LOC129254775 [Lytechinus pictus]